MLRPEKRHFAHRLQYSLHLASKAAASTAALQHLPVQNWQEPAEERAAWAQALGPMGTWLHRAARVSVAIPTDKVLAINVCSVIICWHRCSCKWSSILGRSGARDGKLNGKPNHAEGPGNSDGRGHKKAQITTPSPPPLLFRGTSCYSASQMGTVMGCLDATNPTLASLR